MVLSSLSLRDVVVTSVLSRRWRYLWTSIPRIDFNAAIAPSVSKTNEQEKVNWLNSVIRSMERAPSNNCPEEFRVHLELYEVSQNGIDSWFQFALSKRVRKLDFDFTDEFGYMNDEELEGYKISFELLSQMCEHRKPSTSLINNPFVSLKCLRFRHVRCTSEALRFLLLKCAALESLVLYVVQGLTDVVVSGPSLRLKYLEIKFCHDLRKVEISDANVVSVRYWGASYEELSPRNVPFLVDLFIGTDREVYPNGWQPHGKLKDVFRSISFCYSQLECLRLTGQQNKGDFEIVCMHCFLFNKWILMLHVQFQECYNVEPYQFKRLKQLELFIDPSKWETLLVYTPLIKATPNLEKLVIETSLGERRSKRTDIRSAEKCPHQFLKVLEFHSYSGHECDLELILYFAKNAVSLESITINPDRKIALSWNRRKCERELEMLAHVRLLAKQQLQEILPSQVKLQIL